MAQGAADVRLRDGDHACILFASDQQQRQVVAPFLAEGLRTGQRVLNLAASPPPEVMRSHLREEGTDPDACEASGQLAIRPAREAYLPAGSFDPDATVGMLTGAVRQAVADGWDGMRGSGDMSWAAHGGPGSARIMEYEAKLNQVIPGSRFRALCQYDMRRFSASTLLDVLTTHPVAFIGTRKLENFYHMPPEEHLTGEKPAAQLARWLRNLEERQTDEARRRDEFVREERLRRAQEELAGKNAFLNAVAHELATPLTPLALQLEVLRGADPASRIADHARNLLVLQRGFERLRVTIDQLLLAARAHANSLEVHPEPTDMAHLVAARVQAFAEAARARQVRLRAMVTPGDLVPADPERIRLVLDHLLGNALRFTGADGDVVVEAAARDGGWRVTVADTGLGLDAGQAERAFAPFALLHDPLQVPQQGAGLGLYISRTIVERHGGRIWVESQGRGLGCRFGFWLPG